MLNAIYAGSPVLCWACRQFRPAATYINTMAGAAGSVPSSMVPMCEGCLSLMVGPTITHADGQALARRCNELLAETNRLRSLTLKLGSAVQNLVQAHFQTLGNCPRELTDEDIELGNTRDYQDGFCNCLEMITTDYIGPLVAAYNEVVKDLTPTPSPAPKPAPPHNRPPAAATRQPPPGPDTPGTASAATPPPASDPPSHQGPAP